MKKCKFSSLIILASSTLLLTACGGNNNESDESGGSIPNSSEFGDYVNIDEDENDIPDWMEEEIELSFASGFYGSSNEENPMWLNIEKFMSKYPNITVTRDQKFASGEADDFEQLDMLNALAQEGKLPDIYYSPLAAEVYDREFSLDLTPYVESDEESQWISENAREFMTSYDGETIYGLPWMSVSQYVLINTKLLRENNIAIPEFNWTYDDYEDLRKQIAVLTPNNPIFPGIVNFSEIGPHYFDGIPNGWKGYNIEKQEWDLANSTRFGQWFEQEAKESQEGLHFYDLSEEERIAKVGNLGWAFGDGLQVIDSAWMYELSSNVNDFILDRNMDIEIYPMPTAPEGGQTNLAAYYDTLSISSQLEENPVKAEAAFELVKWLTYGEEGLLSRWSLIDEYTGLPEDAPLRAEDRLLDFIQGWPVTTNPEILAEHPLVKGFSEDSELAVYNFDAFKEESFQQQLSNPVAYPRQMPGFSSVQGNVNTWEIMHQIRDEGVKFNDIAGEWDLKINEQLEDYMRQYSH